MTRVYSISNLLCTLTLCLGLTACNQEDFFEKEEIVDPGTVTTGGVTGGGVDGNTSGVQGGVDSGSQGGVDGGTPGGVDGGSQGGVDGGTPGGVDGGSQGGVDGGTPGGVDSGTQGGADGGTDGGTTGIVYEDRTELFQQSASEIKKLDVLWVIDDSGSMGDEQASLGRNFSAFIDEFIQKDVDFKMAITTTDVSSSTRKGRMVPNSDILLTSAKAKENEVKFKEDFRTLVKVGISGSGAEKGLEATEGFLQKHGSSFIRPDAYLAVVIISDEEDQSPKAVVDYVNQLKAAKSEAGLVKIYTIVDVQNANSGGGITVGHARYKAASNLTAGTVMDIQQDFYNVLGDMGDSIISLLDSFALAETPVAGTLKVYVDGIETTAYTYDSATRSIKFYAPNLPDVGAEIKVTYKIEK